MGYFGEVNLSESLYAEYFPELSPNSNLTPENLAFWYSYRAEQIESRTGMIENGLTMLNLAVQNCIPTNLMEEKIQNLRITLQELGDFVYVWGIDKSISLTGFKEGGVIF